MALEFYDRASFASVALAGDLAAADEARLKAMLTDFLAAVCRATGQVLFEEGHFATADARLGTEAFLVRWDGPIREARRRNARVRHRQRLGWPNVAFLTLVALGFAGLIVWDAVRWATAIAQVDTARPLTFETLRVPPPRRLLFGLFPDFELEGRIVETGSTATVEVYRDQFLLSAPGARYVAFATGQPAMPYVLREFYASKLPILRLGGLAIAWHVAVALLPVGLWLAFVLRPLLRVTAVGRPALLATMTGVAMRLLQIAAVVGIVLGARVVIL